MNRDDKRWLKYLMLMIVVTFALAFALTWINWAVEQ